MARHLLLVDPDAAAADALAGTPALDVTVARSITAARAYLAGSTFDAIAVREDLDPDDALGALAAGLNVPGAVVRYADIPELVAHVGSSTTATASPPQPVAGAQATGAPEIHDALAALRAEIGRVAHDLANPLAVIAGNAQLGAELAGDVGSDGLLAQTFADIGEAAAELERRIADLGALRRRIDALAGRRDG